MRGFTLIEVLITVALFAILVGLGLFINLQTYQGALHRSERDTIVALLERARSRAMANYYQDSWSVCYIAPNYVVAKSSACTAATAYDTIAANGVVATASNFASTFPTITFTKLSGNTTATVIQIKEPGRDDQLVTMNHAGEIDW